LGLLWAANDVAVGIGFEARGSEMEIFLRCLYGFIEERIRDIPSAENP